MINSIYVVRTVRVNGLGQLPRYRTPQRLFQLECEGRSEVSPVAIDEGAI